MRRGSFAALATVGLAEEVAEWKAARNRTGSLPCRWEGWRKGDHIVFVDERTRPIRLWPRPRYDFTRAGRGRRSSLSTSSTLMPMYGKYPGGSPRFVTHAFN